MSLKICNVRLAHEGSVPSKLYTIRCSGDQIVGIEENADGENAPITQDCIEGKGGLLLPSWVPSILKYTRYLINFHL